MDFWAKHLKDSNESWVTTHSIWERLYKTNRHELTNESTDGEYFFEDKDKRGFIIFTHNVYVSKEKNWIYFAYTIPKYRKQGILTNLLKKIDKYDNVIVEVVPNTYKEKIWTKLGYKFYREYGCDDLLMRK
jgi:hypothetical protein